MENFIIAIYCFVDDYLTVGGQKNEKLWKTIDEKINLFLQKRKIPRVFTKSDIIDIYLEDRNDDR